ncbi:MAG: hypothetical protein EPN97_16970 [Alphaproteobacteria bacterium]|nr:MAG: hypothetical protein EPN97_16970 [Alphaproteobacteria bacterium]
MSSKKLKYALFALIAITTTTIGLCATGNFPLQGTGQWAATVTRVRAVAEAVKTFQERYHALPGDMPNAGKVIPGCTGKDGSDCNPVAATSGDGIIGDPDFAKTWKSPITAMTTVPATSAADETTLFWAHLSLTGLIGDMNGSLGIKNGVPIEQVVGDLPARLFNFRNNYFIVGFADGRPLPAELSPKSEGLKGIVLVLMSDEVLHGDAEMNVAGMQALTPRQAAMFDRSMDNGGPDTGYVQAYGAANCFKTYFPTPNSQGDAFYNEKLNERACGLIFKIADSPKDVIPKNPRPSQGQAPR